MSAGSQLITGQKAHSVAIVGLGPKGFYGLERLLAKLKICPLNFPVYIHLFNRSPYFGASPVYDPKQPEYILANISVAEIDLWDTSELPSILERGPNFITWYHEKIKPFQRLTGEEYLSRSIIGQYLIDGFNFLLKQVRANVTVFCHQAEVVDIQPKPQSYKLLFVGEEGNQETLEADKILLATGHSSLIPKLEEKQYHFFAHQHPEATFIPFIYPVTKVMKQVAAGATVAMKGIGLTFIDGVLELTEGRGGKFERLADGNLIYKPSGKEPRSIVPFSRTGLPMVPKPNKEVNLPPFTFLTKSTLETLRNKDFGGKLPLSGEVWSLVELEMELSYYRVEMKAPEYRARLIACGNDGEALRQVIKDYLRVHQDREPFDYQQILDPIADRRFATGSELTRFVRDYMKQQVALAYQGPTKSGVRAAMDIWYQIRKILGSIMQFGGFTPESHHQLLDYYFPQFKRVALGPPIINIEKLLALLNAGLLDFSVARSPQLRLDSINKCFELRCDLTSGAIVKADTLIDARYPSIDISHDATPLYQNLFSRGMVRCYETQSTIPNRSGYCSGAIDMTKDTQFIVDCNGIPNEDIAVIGIPTEGNLVGNFSMLRDPYSECWAIKVIQQLQKQEQLWLIKT